MAERLSGAWLSGALERAAAVEVGVFGDFCVDAYWSIEAEGEELSVETGLPIRRVRRQKYSLGGAGNVAANLASLGVRRVHAVGLVGEDIFGEWMVRELGRQGVEVGGVLSRRGEWQTMVYAKPYVGEEELNRFDFGAFNEVGEEAAEALVRELERVAGRCAVVILNQQVPAGVSSAGMIERINGVIARHPETRFLVDARHRAGLYRGAALKLNAHEAARLAGEPRGLEERISAGQVRGFAGKLAKETGRAVFITRGENGIVAAEGEGEVHEVPGIQIVDAVDAVGAGDTVVSALAAVLGSGGSVLTAARVANIAASVTVRKLRTTGTASVAEILAVGPEPDYVYAPELAADPRRAELAEGTEIEVVGERGGAARIRHAVFDHDGTISTLRQGWEEIMEPMMVRAILGGRYAEADETLYHKVVGTVRQFIDRTTGIQTLVQMQGLVDLVRRFGCVAEREILDAAGYKGVYNAQLLEKVGERVRKLERGELEAEDFMIKGVGKFLRRLHEDGVKLYLASGTDEGDVAAEAAALGYAGLFEGRIFGAVGDVKVEAKKVVLERIMREHGLAGRDLATFGDGPVEMQETRKRGGVCVGIASDEVRRHGLNLAKRTRLIRAGAEVVAADFSQGEALWKVLGLGG